MSIGVPLTKHSSQIINLKDSPSIDEPSLAEIAVTNEPLLREHVCPFDVVNCKLKSGSFKTASADGLRSLLRIRLYVICACLCDGANIPIHKPSLNGCSRLSFANIGIFASCGSKIIIPPDVSEIVSDLPLCLANKAVISAPSFVKTERITLFENCS